MRELKGMLRDAVGREEILRAARAQRVMRDWAAIVGPMLAGKSHPDKYDRGTVWVSVEGSAWAQELRMIKEQILERLSSKANENGLFLDIRFGVRPLLPNETEPVPEPPAPPRDPQEESTISDIAVRRLKNWVHS